MGFFRTFPSCGYDRLHATPTSDGGCGGGAAQTWITIRKFFQMALKWANSFQRRSILDEKISNWETLERVLMENGVLLLTVHCSDADSEVELHISPRLNTQIVKF